MRLISRLHVRLGEAVPVSPSGAVCKKVRQQEVAFKIKHTFYEACYIQGVLMFMSTIPSVR
jgi:hypothetical protein